MADGLVLGILYQIGEGLEVGPLHHEHQVGIKLTDANRTLTVGRRVSRTQASIPHLNKRGVGAEPAASKHS